MRILAIDAALARCSAALVEDGVVLAEREREGARGHAAALPVMVREVLADSPATTLDAVAVCVGPGSFTGLRASLSLAHGIGRAAGIPVLGVSVAEALAVAIAPGAGRALWVAIDSRRGRVFLDRPGFPLAAFALDDLPCPATPILIAGDAAPEVARIMAARGDDARLAPAALPRARDLAAVGARRLAGALPPLDAQPLYVDPPEAKLPAGGLRPPPA